MEQLEFEDINIDRKETAKKVKYFITKVVPRYQRLCGEVNFTLSSPQMSLAPARTSKINYQENKILDDIKKKNTQTRQIEYARRVLSAIGLTFTYCDIKSQEILKNSLFEGKSDVMVASKIQYSERQFAKYKQEALCQFAESWVSASKLFKCENIVLLVQKKRKCKKDAKKVQV